MGPGNIKNLAEQVLAAMHDPDAKARARLVGPAPTDAYHREVKQNLLDTFARNVPRGFRWVVSDEKLRQRVRPPEAVAYARDRAIKLKSMMLTGDTGAGKTSLAMACYRAIAIEAIRALEDGEAYSRETCRTLIRASLGAVVVSARKLARGSMEAPLGKGIAPIVGAAMTAPLLVLDDLGQELEIFRGSSSAVGEVIQERHAEKLPTLVTTYLSERSLANEYGDGIRRRLVGWGVIKLGTPWRTSGRTS